jgi:hypothetical protein
MIKQQTVLMATPLAQMATEKGLSLHDAASDIIKGLDETTASIVSFTPDNIATELPDYTALVPDHTDVMEATTTVVADTIRASLYVIAKNIKPITTSVEERLRQTLSADSAVETILSNVQLEMINVEPSFLNSHFYPQQPAAAFREAQTIRLSDLVQGSYPRLTGAELAEMISVEVADLQPYLVDQAEIQRVYETLFVDKYFYQIFSPDAISDGVVNISSPRNYRFSSFRSLVISTMLLNKFTAMDDPVDGVTGVSLDDYRASLRMTRDLFNTMLWHFKNIWEQRAAAGIVVIDNGLQYAPQQDGITGSLPVIKGPLTIGYNNAILTMFADSDQLSLSEYVLGFVYAKFRDYRVKDIITDKETVIEAWREYQLDVNTALMANKGDAARKVFTQVMETLAGKEEYQPLLEVMEDNVPLAQRALARVRAQLDLNMFFNNTGMLDAIVRGNNTLMNTPLAAVLANVFDSPIACEILTINAKNPAGTLEQQRKALSLAIDQVIIKRLLKV